jgi:hypothetical protein
MLNSGEKKYSSSRVVRKQISERNKKPKETANIIEPILTKNYQQSINTGQIPED